MNVLFFEEMKTIYTNLKSIQVKDRIFVVFLGFYKGIFSQMSLSSSFRISLFDVEVP